MAVRYPFRRHLVKDDVLIFEDVIGHDIVLLQVQIVIVGQCPCHLHFLVVRSLCFSFRAFSVFSIQPLNSRSFLIA